MSHDPITDLWVQALIRRVQMAGSFATVLRRGDSKAGAVLVKAVDRRRGVARLYAEAMRGDGETVWMEPCGHRGSGPDAYAERAGGRDPDLWVVEIEDRRDGTS
jgi:hypothetical protein